MYTYSCKYIIIYVSANMHMNYGFGYVFVDVYSSVMNHMNAHPCISALILHLSAYVALVITA